MSITPDPKPIPADSQITPPVPPLDEKKIIRRWLWKKIDRLFTVALCIGFGMILGALQIAGALLGVPPGVTDALAPVLKKLATPPQPVPRAIPAPPLPPSRPRAPADPVEMSKNIEGWIRQECAWRTGEINSCGEADPDCLSAIFRKCLSEGAGAH